MSLFVECCVCIIQPLKITDEIRDYRRKISVKFCKIASTRIRTAETSDNDMSVSLYSFCSSIIPKLVVFIDTIGMKKP